MALPGTPNKDLGLSAYYKTLQALQDDRAMSTLEENIQNGLKYYKISQTLQNSSKLHTLPSILPGRPKQDKKKGDEEIDEKQQGIISNMQKYCRH